MTNAQIDCRIIINPDHYLPDDEDNLGVKFTQNGTTLHINDRVTWDKTLCISPEKALFILGRDLPPCKIDIILPINGRSYLGKITYRAQDNSFCDSRGLNFDSGYAQRGQVQVRDKSKGIGRILMRNQIDFYRAIGLKGIEILASSDHGAYVWPRFGFVEDCESGVNRYYTQTVIPKRLLGIMPFLKASEIKDIVPPVLRNRSTDLWRVADAPYDVSEALNGIAFPSTYSRTASLKLKKMFANLAQSVYMSGPSNNNIRQFAGELLSQQRPISMGQYLLLQGSIFVRMDFENAAQIKRAEKYAGMMITQETSPIPPRLS